MKFIVSRASETNNNIPPCEGVVKVVATLYRDRQKCSLSRWRKNSPDMFERVDLAACGEAGGYAWIDFHTCRCLWVLELKTIEDLNDFIEKNGEVVIYEKCLKWPEFELPELLIYDDLME